MAATRRFFRKFSTSTAAKLTPLQQSQLDLFKVASHVFTEGENHKQGVTKVAFSDSTPENVDCVVHFVSPEDRECLSKTYGVNSAAVEDLFAGKGGGKTRSHMEYAQGTRNLFVSMGDIEKADADTLRAVTHTAVTQLRKCDSVQSAALALPNSSNVPLLTSEDGDIVSVVTRTACLSNYQFNRYKSTKADDGEETLSVILDTITIVASKDDDAPFNAIEENASPDSAAVASMTSSVLAPTRAAVSTILADTTLFARDLGNLRADVVNPAFVECVAEQIADEFSDTVSLKVLHQTELEEKGMGLITAVGQGKVGSDKNGPNSARLVVLEYDGSKFSNSKDSDWTALIGKTVTFDTGGLNLKPTGSIEGMHLDMCGGAAVLSAVKAAAQLEISQRVVAVLAIAENAIDADSFYPLQIVKGMDGRTVEVGNTDAEGRLCLADAITWTQETYNPPTMIDMATLTGACVVALGEYAAGVFTNEKGANVVTPALSSAAQRVKERVHPLPILPEHRKEILEGSEHADLSSTGQSRYGGASTAAAYLESYVDKECGYAHIDIAGPSMYSKAIGEMPAGGTGFGGALLAQYLLDCDQKK